MTWITFGQAVAGAAPVTIGSVTEAGHVDRCGGARLLTAHPPLANLVEQ